MIGAVGLILLVCVLFWYGNRQKENGADLYSIQGENGIFLGELEFEFGVTGGGVKPMGLKKYICL